MLRASLSITSLTLGFSVILMLQVIHQFCAAKNQQIQEYSNNQNITQTTEAGQHPNTVPTPAYPQQQTVTIKAPPHQSQPQAAQQAPTYIQLPNGQLQLIQPCQAQTVYVAPPMPPPIYKTSEEHLASFAIAEAIMMMLNIAFAAICVYYLAMGFQLCKKYDSNA